MCMDSNQNMENTTVSLKNKSHEKTIPFDSEEDFVNRVYSTVDETIARELEQLRRRKGIIPTCGSGCGHCCRHHILTNDLEAHTLVQHIKREFSEQQILDLKMRTQQWHVWDNRMPGRHPLKHTDKGVDMTGYTHSCPLNVNGSCSAYNARPVVCRAHYVSSPVRACRTAHDLESANAPVKLRSIEAATRPFSKSIKDHIECKGMDFSRSVMLLPHWLAEKMDWIFD